MAARLGSGGRDFVAVGMVLGKGTGAAEVVDREVTARLGSGGRDFVAVGMVLGKGTGAAEVVDREVGASVGAGTPVAAVQALGSGPTPGGSWRLGGGPRVVVSVRAGSPPPAAANAKTMNTSRKPTNATRSSRSYIIRAMEAFEIPSERPSNFISGWS